MPRQKWIGFACVAAFTVCDLFGVALTTPLLREIEAALGIVYHRGETVPLLAMAVIGANAGLLLGVGVALRNLIDHLLGFWWALALILIVPLIAHGLWMAKYAAQPTILFHLARGSLFSLFADWLLFCVAWAVFVLCRRGTLSARVAVSGLATSVASFPIRLIEVYLSAPRALTDPGLREGELVNMTAKAITALVVTLVIAGIVNLATTSAGNEQTTSALKP